MVGVRTKMSENPILITALNDFIFCPVSIYFHSLDNDSEVILYQDKYQLDGTAAHKNVDNATYSTKKNMLQGSYVYCEKYNLSGRIDVFDIDRGILTERKKKIVNIYDGYVFQLYAQYYSLIELGYKVNRMRLYSADDNKVFYIKKPEEDDEMRMKFEKTIQDMNDFTFEGFIQENEKKCLHCIYEELCSFSKLKVSKC